MMRSIAYSRYFSTATAMQTGNAATPNGLMMSSANCPGRTIDVTQAAAPLQSHLS
jgi:hypothetical protein